MKDKFFIVTIEKEKDGTYIAYNVDESPYTLIGRGATVKEAKADFANSMQEIKESEEERGRLSENSQIRKRELSICNR